MKVILVGNPEVGKTSYVNSLLGKDFQIKYVPTLGVEIKQIDGLAIWDTAGQKKYMGLGNGYYNGANAAIIMISPESQSFKDWYESIVRICGDIPICLVLNKADKLPKGFKIKLPKNLKYFEISSKNKNGIDDPINWINGN